MSIARRGVPAEEATMSTIRDCAYFVEVNFSKGDVVDLCFGGRENKIDIKLKKVSCVEAGCSWVVSGEVGICVGVGMMVVRLRL